jgi:dipeptidyl aminopeptidase/acylaminoacyl peptidase
MGRTSHRVRRANEVIGCALVASMVAAASFCCRGQSTNDIDVRLRTLDERLSHLEARLARQIDEQFWFQALAPFAECEKVSFAGPAPHNSNAAPGSNMVIVSAMAFVPKQQGRFAKLPLIVLAHGEIHGNTASCEHEQVIAELIRQGYAVIAPDYRGSAGYGADFFKLIDYGGLEIEDVHAGRQFMLERYPNIDPKRVGIIGWSHGGLIALMTVFAHPEAYAVCYAGVPVSDLEERIRIRGKDYEQLFAAPYHLGKTVAEAPEEYRKRSPAANATKLKTPLLVQANTNDEDVTAREIAKLIEALQAAGKDFQYHLYTNAPGGHLFNRLDTEFARDSRREIYSFLARQLKPAHPEARP